MKATRSMPKAWGDYLFVFFWRGGEGSRGVDFRIFLVVDFEKKKKTRNHDATIFFFFIFPLSLSLSFLSPRDYSWVRDRHCAQEATPPGRRRRTSR